MIASPVTIQHDPQKPRSFCQDPACAVTLTSDFSMWKAYVRNWIRRVLDVPVDPSRWMMLPAGLSIVPDPPPAPASADGVTRMLVRYKSIVDQRMLSAYLYLPPGFTRTRRYPAVLVTHGHFYVEHKEGAGEKWHTRQHADARFLAENGAITLAPDTRSFGDSCIADDCGGECDEQHDCHDTWTGNQRRQAASEYIADDLTHLTVLMTLPIVDGQPCNCVDPARVFSAGLSMGTPKRTGAAAHHAGLRRQFPANAAMRREGPRPREQLGKSVSSLRRTVAEL